MNYNENCILITDEKNWIEQAAKDQLAGISRLSGVKRAVGLPDLHPGKSPVGIGLLTEGRFYPHLIGNDIGCGMGLFCTGIRERKFKQDKAVTRLNYLKDLSELVTENPYPEESPILALGTIGSGNHFAEFQKVEQICDENLFAETGMEKEQLYLLVHSGSRGYGQRILNQFYHPEGLLADSEEATLYLAEITAAVVTILLANSNLMHGSVKNFVSTLTFVRLKLVPAIVASGSVTAPGALHFNMVLLGLKKHFFFSQHSSRHPYSLFSFS